MIDKVRIVDEVRRALNGLFDEPDGDWTRGVKTLKHPPIGGFVCGRSVELLELILCTQSSTKYGTQYNALH